MVRIEAQVPLAVTEIMGYASDRCGTNYHAPNADWFELTNFGPTPIDITGYYFCDREHLRPWRFPRCIIGPGESVIFVRPNGLTADAEAFRDWWERDRLPADLQIMFYQSTDWDENSYGLNDIVDGVRIYDASSNLVDYAYYGDFGGRAVGPQGVTITYETSGGLFGVLSQEGVCGAWKAACPNDVGSPGFTCGPVKLSILQQPTSQTVDGGMEVVLEVRAAGLPRPRCQWLCNGEPIPGGQTFGTNTSQYVIPIAEPRHAGQYSVVLDNGLEQVVSAAATLVVNTNPMPASIVRSPRDRWALARETVTFAVKARGYPVPVYRWQFCSNQWHSCTNCWVEMSGPQELNPQVLERYQAWCLTNQWTDIEGATNSTLVRTLVSGQDVGTYRVWVQNSCCRTNVCAVLCLTRKPLLAITEAMSLACTNHGLPGTGDYWEATNLDTDAIDLREWFWDDAPGSVGGGPTISNCFIIRAGESGFMVEPAEPIIQPGESVIFVEGLTPEMFATRWGWGNLPTDLKIIRHTANGLDDNKDEITLWNPTATQDNSYIASIGFVTEAAGVSLWFAPTVCAEFGVPSVPGEGGAFQAVASCDVGSPGWTPWTPPRFTSIYRSEAGVKLAWKTQPGSSCLLQFKRELTEADWTLLGRFTPTGAFCSATDTTIGLETRRFYRAVTIPYCTACTDDLPTAVAGGVAEWPGWILERPPRFTSMTRDASNVTLGWQTHPGTTNVLQYRTNLADGTWRSLSTNVATTDWLETVCPINPAGPPQFFRVICLPHY
jgi:hypothetical protein